MTPKPSKKKHTKLVAFKIEQDLANLLEQLPNKSEVLRQALYSHLRLYCPLCRGFGKISPGDEDEPDTDVADLNCDHCGEARIVLLLAQQISAWMHDQRRAVGRGAGIECFRCFLQHPAGPSTTGEPPLKSKTKKE